MIYRENRVLGNLYNVILFCSVFIDLYVYLCKYRKVRINVILDEWKWG